MISIDLHTTETQNVQSTIHYLSKCFVQIKEKDMYIPNLLFVASIDMMTRCTRTRTFFSTVASISCWGTGQGAINIIISSRTFYKSHICMLIIMKWINVIAMQMFVMIKALLVLYKYLRLNSYYESIPSFRLLWMGYKRLLFQMHICKTQYKLM